MLYICFQSVLGDFFANFRDFSQSVLRLHYQAIDLMLMGSVAQMQSYSMYLNPDWCQKVMSPQAVEPSNQETSICQHSGDI